MTTLIVVEDRTCGSKALKTTTLLSGASAAEADIRDNVYTHPTDGAKWKFLSVSMDPRGSWNGLNPSWKMSASGYLCSPKSKTEDTLLPYFMMAFPGHLWETIVKLTEAEMELRHSKQSIAKSSTNKTSQGELMRFLLGWKQGLDRRNGRRKRRIPEICFQRMILATSCPEHG